MYRSLLTEEKSGIGWITFNRPESLNALDAKARKELIDCLGKMERNRSIAVVVLTGSGDRAFCAGADLKAFVDFSPKEARSYVRLAKATTRKIELLRKPVIAAVNGLALGTGCEIALACDVVVASKNARFGQPEINVGLIPGAGGTQRLPRIVGQKRAKEMIFTGRLVDASEAMAMGMVNRVVEPGRLKTEVDGICQELRKKSPLILEFAKRCVNVAAELRLPSGLEFESKMFSRCFGTRDQKEGLSAFFERRRPHFRGR